MKRSASVMITVSIAVLLIASSYASATFASKTFSTLVVAKGNVLAGNLASLSTVDGNVLTVASNGSGSSTVIYEFPPNSDNTSDDYGWARNCGSYWQCVLDGGSAYTDGNTTIMWTTTTGPHASIGFLDAGYLLLGRTIIDVTLWAWIRSNSTGILGLSLELRDPITATTCVSVGTPGILTWALYGAVASDCSGTPWTPDMVDRVEAKLLALTNLGEVVSTVYLSIRTSVTPYIFSSYLNGTVTPTQTPISLNWTCNRTSSMGNIYVYIWAQGPVSGWRPLTNDGCATGAQAGYSVSLSSAYTYVAGNAVSVWVRSTATLSIGNASFDEFRFGTNDTFVPPPAQDFSWLAWVLLFGLACAVIVYAAIWWHQRQGD